MYQRQAQLVQDLERAVGPATGRDGESDALVGLAEGGLVEIADLQAATIATPPTPRPADRW